MYQHLNRHNTRLYMQDRINKKLHFLHFNQVYNRDRLTIDNPISFVSTRNATRVNTTFLITNIVNRVPFITRLRRQKIRHNNQTEERSCTLMLP